MDSRNGSVRDAYFKFCNWGIRTKVVYEEPYKGGPTPLWKNISVPYFERLSAISIVFLIACIIEYILVDRVKQEEFTKS